eukprot:3202576-Amphidinium_carterae.1
MPPNATFCSVFWLVSNNALFSCVTWVRMRGPSQEWPSEASKARFLFFAAVLAVPGRLETGPKMPEYRFFKPKGYAMLAHLASALKI